jgi:hypothetical protein
VFIVSASCVTLMVTSSFLSASSDSTLNVHSGAAR